MKDYKQVTDSVFKKAEQRIAEKKRRTAIIRRNAIAASGLAAALFIILLQNDDIRSALNSLPKLASSGWFDKAQQSKHATTTLVTTQTPTKKHTTTSKTTSTETTTTETTSTSTTETSITIEVTDTTTTEAATMTAIVTTTSPPTVEEEKPSKITGKPLILIGNWYDTVISATSDVIELENGMKIGLEYGAVDYRNKFKTGDVIKYTANFVYDNNDGIYYYVDGYIDYEEKRNGYLHFPEYITEIDNAPYKEYYGFDDPYEEVFDGGAFIDYNTLLSYTNFKFAENTVYKIEAKNIKLVDSPINDFFKTEDGQLWYISDSKVLNFTSKQFESLKIGDTISFAGYFAYYESDNSLSPFAIVIKKEN